MTKAGVFSKGKIDDGTKLLLENIETKNGDEILDLGCGYGVMGIIAGSVSKGKTTFVDSDIRAVRLTEKNIRENKIDDTEILISDGFSDLEDRKFDLILTYPPGHEGQETVEEFVKGSSEHLKEKGKFYLVTESRLKNYYERLFKKYFKTWGKIKRSKNHNLFLGEN